MSGTTRPLHVSLVAIPDAVISTLTGIYDVLGSFRMLGRVEPSIPESPPFTVEIVAVERGNVALASGVPVEAHRSISEVAATDIIIVPSVLLGHDGWALGRYPQIVDWICRMHDEGALLCSACSGVFLLAETGLFDGRDATVHWGYAEAFAKVFPGVPLSPERVLVVSGEREEFITSGASMTWHDLVLYLIARHVDATAAQTVARYFALQWHHDGLAPYIVFQGRRDHGDAAIADAQDWLSTHSPSQALSKKWFGVRASPSGRSSGALPRRLASRRLTMSSASGSRTPSAGSSARMSLLMRLAGGLATRTPPSSAACSSA
jgi:transcriptional regulator GlxA family with amidase domain